jgi:hypothetical protein
MQNCLSLVAILAPNRALMLTIIINTNTRIKVISSHGIGRFFAGGEPFGCTDVSAKN